MGITAWAIEGRSQGHDNTFGAHRRITLQQTGAAPAFGSV
jgi:hypothetical protein